jgi:predicted nicotinamide N-methyase
MSISFDTIARVQLIRSPRSHIKVSSLVRLQVKLTSEFSDPIINLINYYDFKCYLSLIRNEQQNLYFNNEINIMDYQISIDNFSASFNIKLPDISGLYQLLLIAKNKQDDINIINPFGNVYILPLIINDISVYDPADCINDNIIPTTILSCYRLFNKDKYLLNNEFNNNNNNNNNNIIIKEEYGSTIGSHIYDSAIVLSKYFHNNLEELFINNGKNYNIVELGSGCGLVGIMLSIILNKINSIDNTNTNNNRINNVFTNINSNNNSNNNLLNHQIYLTDKYYQLPLIDTNIKLNNVENNCVSLELTWENNQDINNLKNKIDEIDIIIGADVLYNKDLACLFLNIVKEIAIPSRTVIYIGQKLRDIDKKGSFDINTVDGFACRKLVVESNVIIWSLTLL